jgi:alpha-tubulin suppressor-like RCC1 family protein
MLNGMVTRTVGDANAWFEWGTDQGYGNTIGETNVASGAGVVFLTTALAGLSVGQIYHYHLVVSNAFGRSSGADQQFALGGTVLMSSSAYVSAPPGGLVDIVALSGGGNNAVALRNNGTVAVWGDNSYGQLNVPAGLSNVVAVAAGQHHVLALKSDGTVATWGYLAFPLMPTNLSNVIAIAAGTFHSLALKSDGTVVEWGNNSQGQGVPPPGLSNVVGIAAGDWHSTALRDDGTVVVWGDNSQGQQDIPSGLNNVMRITSGWYHNLALKNDGTVAAWGLNSASPSLVPEGLTNVVGLGAGYLNSLALRTDGTIVPWGRASVPAGVSNVVAIAGGYDFTLALVSPPPTPMLDLDSIAVSGGNGNGLVDPNECNDLRVAIRNHGTGTATNLSAVLSSSTPGVTIVQGTSTYPDLVPGAVASNRGSFKMVTSPSYVCGTPINLTLTMVYVGGTSALSLHPPHSGNDYTLSQITGASIVPGTTDTGNHADDGTTTITLPFTYGFYGQNFTTATVDSNGSLQFNTHNTVYTNTCLPAAGFIDAIFAHWDDLRTDGNVGGTQGIFTSVTGVLPNRIFNIEWRASYYDVNANGDPINFEIRLYEGQARFDLVYGSLNGVGASATVGVQHGSSFTQFECNSGGLSAGLELIFQRVACSDGGGACPATPPMIVGPSQNGTNLNFSFGTSIGFTYVVQYKNSLSDSIWQTLQSVPGDGTVKTITDAIATAGQRFYRVSVQ